MEQRIHIIEMIIEPRSDQLCSKPRFRQSIAAIRFDLAIDVERDEQNQWDSRHQHQNDKLRAQAARERDRPRFRLGIRDAHYILASQKNAGTQ